MATIEEILAGTDTRFYDGRDQTFNPNKFFKVVLLEDLIKTIQEY